MTTNRIQELDSSSFQDAISGSDQPVLVDFHAAWCPPCHALAPTIDSLADEYADRVLVGKVDIDANQDLAQEFEIRSIPTVLVFVNGQIVGRFVGVAPRDELARSLDEATALAAA